MLEMRNPIDHDFKGNGDLLFDLLGGDPGATE